MQYELQYAESTPLAVIPLLFLLRRKERTKEENFLLNMDITKIESVARTCRKVWHGNVLLLRVKDRRVVYRTIEARSKRHECRKRRLYRKDFKMD
jgi:hypothetical protein